jgi:hypothetical protein
LTARANWNNGFMDLAEVGLMGYPAFTHSSTMKTPSFPFPSVAESVERPVYAALNLDKIDIGFGILGTVATVFTPSYVRNLTLVSAVDTGWWENSCNSSYTPTNVNCSAWDRTLGVLQKGGFDHILLANVELWAPSGWSFERLFARMFGNYGAKDYPAVGSDWQYGIFTSLPANPLSNKTPPLPPHQAGIRLTSSTVLLPLSICNYIEGD